VTNNELRAEVDRLKAENAKLAERVTHRAVAGLSLKVSEKGGVSVYGLGRFPVTLYAGQWDRLLAEADRVKAFIVANADRMAVKGSV